MRLVLALVLACVLVKFGVTDRTRRLRPSAGILARTYRTGP